MSQQPKIRFAAGSADGPRSAVWSVTWWKSDVYLIASEVPGIAKISLHLRTGEFNFGYVREFFEQNKSELGVSSRFFEQWHRPPPLSSGLTLPLRLYFANEALKTDPKLPTQKHIEWLVPPKGRAAGIFILITPPAITADPLVGQDVVLLKRMQLTEHPEPVWLYAHFIDEAALCEAALRSLRGFKEAAPHIQLHDRHRLYGLQDAEPETGARILIETPVAAV